MSGEPFRSPSARAPHAADLDFTFGSHQWTFAVGAADWAQRVHKLQGDIVSNRDPNTGEAWNIDDLEGCCVLRDALESALTEVGEGDTRVDAVRESDELFRSFIRELSPDQALIIHPGITTTEEWWWRRIPVEGPLAAEANERVSFARLLGRPPPGHWVEDLATHGRVVGNFRELLDVGDTEIGDLPVGEWLDDIDSVETEDRSALLRLLLRLVGRTGGARSHAPVLMRLFTRAALGPESGDAFEIALTVAPLLGDAPFDEVAELLTDRRFGRARQPLLRALGASEDPRAVDLLIECLADDDLVVFALVELARVREPRSRGAIEAVVASERWPVRFHARRALTRLDHQESGSSAARAD